METKTKNISIIEVFKVLIRVAAGQGDGSTSQRLSLLHSSMLNIEVLERFLKSSSASRRSFMRFVSEHFMVTTPLQKKLNITESRVQHCFFILTFFCEIYSYTSRGGEERGQVSGLFEEVKAANMHFWSHNDCFLVFEYIWLCGI